MAVRSARLVAQSTAPAGAVHTAYTVPAGRTVLLKDIRVSWLSGTVGRATVIARSGPVNVVLIDAPVPPTDPIGAEVWVVLEPGDELAVYSEGGTCWAYLSGSELEGVAP